MKIIFGKLEEMLSELKEKGISEVRIDSLFQDKRTSNEGIFLMKAFVSVGAILRDQEVANFESVVFKNLKPFNNEEVEKIIRDTLKAENAIKQNLAEHGFTVRNGYFAEAVS